jgi:hypothetical protein
MMKTKFLLTLLALNGLFFGATSASAYTVAPIEHDYNISNLSRTISESIDLNRDYYSLIELAIDRALLAKGDKNSETVDPIPAGGISVQTDPKPIINGKVANPRHRPLKNGIIIDRSQIKPPINENPIINGVVVDRHQK